MHLAVWANSPNCPSRERVFLKRAGVPQSTNAPWLRGCICVAWGSVLQMLLYVKRLVLLEGKSRQQTCSNDRLPAFFAQPDGGRFFPSAGRRVWISQAACFSLPRERSYSSKIRRFTLTFSILSSVACSGQAGGRH